MELQELPGKKNIYNSLVNDALDFSLDFYKTLLAEAVDAKGVLRVVNDNFTQDKLVQNNIKYDYFDNQKLKSISDDFMNIDGYFYENAAVIEPIQICKKLTQECDFYKKDIIFNIEFYFFCYTGKSKTRIRCNQNYCSNR